MAGAGGGRRALDGGVPDGSGNVWERFRVWVLWLCIAACAAAWEAVRPLMVWAFGVALERVGSKNP